jgi:hypothetical protein
MITGLHSRKKALNQDNDLDPEMPKPPSSGGGYDDEMKTHGRSPFLRRVVRSEVGCALRVVVGFLVFGLFFGYVILHHQTRKVRFSCYSFELGWNGMELRSLVHSYFSYGTLSKINAIGYEVLHCSSFIY